MYKWKNKLINRAIKHYEYGEEIADGDENFIQHYKNFSRKENLKRNTGIVWLSLDGNPNCTHIAAKKLLFQGSPDCWKYFERAALFWTMSHINDPLIDFSRGVFEYSLYIERKDLIEVLFEGLNEELNREENKKNKEIIRQKVYPSTQFLHFLIEKWLVESPVKEQILKFGSGYGIYQPIIDNWDNLSPLPASYWDELCEYHLRGIGLARGEKWENEEFLDSGLIPMELINLIKVRKKAGLDIPVIEHELFQTPMAKEPLIPTGYNKALDVKYQLVKHTVETKRTYTYNEILSILKEEYGQQIDLMM